jgi:hypothetical protein
MQARQGDVLIARVEHLPANVKKVATRGGRIILVEGEATGHHHSVPARGTTLLEPSDYNDAEFLKIMKAAGFKDPATSGARFIEITQTGAELVHQEHDAIALPPGFYAVARQREYTSADMAPMPVAD